MEAAIFIGIQASGKSTFFKDRFFDTHVRINLDMLRTRHRESLFVEACVAAKQPFVVDNTNPTPEDRARYIQQAKAAGFRIVGYYFQSKLEDCKARNEARHGKRRIPTAGLLGTYGRLTRPSKAEGFDELWYVRMGPEGSFLVEEWNDEV